MECRNHPSAGAADRCAGCMEPFCPNCLVTVKGRTYCASCKIMSLGGQAPSFPELLEPCPEANEALKYGIIAFFCFGIILGPIAISKAMAAKRALAANPNLIGWGKANAALFAGCMAAGLWVLNIVTRGMKA